MLGLLNSTSIKLILILKVLIVSTYIFILFQDGSINTFAMKAKLAGGSPESLFHSSVEQYNKTGWVTKEEASERLSLQEMDELIERQKVSRANRIEEHKMEQEKLNESGRPLSEMLLLILLITFIFLGKTKNTLRMKSYFLGLLLVISICMRNNDLITLIFLMFLFISLVQGASIKVRQNKKDSHNIF